MDAAVRTSLAGTPRRAVLIKTELLETQTVISKVGAEGSPRTRAILKSAEDDCCISTAVVCWQNTDLTLIA